MPIKLILRNVRFSYVHVFEPKAMEGSDRLKYSVSVLIDKKDKKTIAKFEEAVKEAMEEGKSKWGNKIPKNLKTPLRDGDLEREDDEVYEGKVFFGASSSNKPGIVDEDLEEIMDKDEFYSGCYGNVSINLYAFDKNGNRGIAAGLNNLQKTKDGEKLSGGSSAADDFGKDEDDLS